MQSTEEDGGGRSEGEPAGARRPGTKMKKKQLSCAVSRQHSLKLPSDMEDASVNSAGRVAVQKIPADQESAKEGEKVRLEPLLDEDASAAPSELYETDSSNDQGSFINANDNNSSSSSEKLLGPGLQGQDIVAGSPSKVPDVATAPQNENEEQQAEKESANQVDVERGREEMGGVIVYDSYAKLTGCTKIVEYFAAQERRKVDTRVLFSQQEAKALQKTLFFEKARERDFQCDQDRHLWRNLPRFQTQRDFANPQFSIHVPQQQNILIFDSRFENGNLRKAAKINNVEYNLWLENDVNTKGHTQWYYFKVVYKDIAVRADKKTHTIKFNVLNLAKTTSLYQVGMKPCIWSRRRFEEEEVGWFRGGEEVTYTQNNILRETDFTADHQKMQTDENNNNAFLYNNNGAGEGVDTYFTLSFKYAFVPNQDDEVWFAHAIPSTYTQLQESLLKARESPEYEPFLRMNMLCQSLAKTPVPLLTITENVDTYLDYYEEIKLQTHLSGIVKKSFKQKYNNTKKLAKQSQQTRGQVKALLDRAVEEELRQFFEYNEDHFIQASPSFQGFGQRLINYVKIHSQKKAVVITSRVHPGEPQASHMVNGLIAYLLSPKAIELRRHFVFRIVPMLNPDGVIYGNYRCSLLGCDLNRKWDKPNKYLHPPIYYAKNIVRHMHQERKVLLFCDLHGHSRKQNAFFYGCCYKNYEHEGRIKNAQLRIIPLMCCQKNELFKLKGCRFRLERGREATARVAIFKEFNIMNSFTLECSFFGKEHSNKKKPIDRSDPFAVLQQQTKKLEHMSQEDYESLGETLMKTMHSYLPGEQHLLEFVSGRILDVFYEEFVKFIPPFMLKREREKREQAEEEARKEQGKHQRHDGPGGSVARSSLKPNALNKLATSDLGGQLLMMPSGHHNNSTQRSLQRQKTLNVTQSMASGGQGGNANASALQGSPQHKMNRRHSKKPVNTNLVGIREVSGGSSSKATPGGTLSQFRNSQDYNGQEDNPQQAEQVSGLPINPNPSANFNYKDSSSDQQAQNMFLSGNDTDNTNQGQGGRMGANFHSNKEEMLEFETFFDNIQQNMKRKEMVKAQRAQLKDGEVPIEDLGELSEDEDSGTSSDDQTYKERTRRPKKKKKKQQPGNHGKGQRTAQRKKEAREDGQTAGGAGGGTKHKASNQAGNRDVVGGKNKSQSSTTAAYTGTNRLARSPRHQQIDSLAPILGAKKAHDRGGPQQQKQEEVQPQIQATSERQGSTGAGAADKGAISGCELTDVRTSELQPCPAEAILRSSEIQGLIKSQLSTGVLNQNEIMQVIQRAILKNQALAQLRAQQNKNRLLVNHPQSEGMDDNARPFEEQNHPMAERQRKEQLGKVRKEPEQQLKPLRIATSDGQGYQPGTQPQHASPQYLANHNPGSVGYIGQGIAQARNDPQIGTSGGLSFNPSRPAEDSKESPLLPQPARHGKYLGQSSNFRPHQASYQQHSQYSNQIPSHGQQSQQTGLPAFQHHSQGGQNMQAEANASAKFNSAACGGPQQDIPLASSASQGQRGPKSQLSQHGTAEKIAQASAHSPQIRTGKARNGPAAAADSFAIVAMPDHSQTVKIDKMKKFQTLGRPGGLATAASCNAEFNNLMLRNATDVRELPSIYEGSPIDPFGRAMAPGVEALNVQVHDDDETASNLKRPAQSAMQDRQNDQEQARAIEEKNSRSLSGQQSVNFMNASGTSRRQPSNLHNYAKAPGNGRDGDGKAFADEKAMRAAQVMQQLDAAQDLGAGGHRGSRYQKAKNRHSLGVDGPLSKDRDSDGSADAGPGGKDALGGQRWTTQERIIENQQTAGAQPTARRSPSVMSPDAGSGLGAALGQGPAHYQPDANRHEFSQPVINGRQPAQLDPSLPGRTDNQKKLLQYGGWAMSGYTTMPLKSQLVAADYRDSRVSASNNALGKIVEAEPMSQQMPGEAASARKQSHELRLGSSSYAQKQQAAYTGQANMAIDGDRPRPQLHINAQLNAARTNQQVGLSPGTLGAGGLASVGIARVTGGQYQNLSQYHAQAVAAHDRGKADRPEGAHPNAESLPQGHNLNYGPNTQPQLPRGVAKPNHSNQPSLRQSPTAASAGSTIIGNQRRNPRANVMQDLRDQIAHESAALEMLNKRKQLQLQLERQQQLLHQLQNQLISHQLNGPAGIVEGAEPGSAASAKPAQHEDYQSSLMQTGSVISGNKVRGRPTAAADVKQSSMADHDQSPGAPHNASPSKTLGRPPARGVQGPRLPPNDLGQLVGSPDATHMAHARARRNQDVAEDTMAAVLTRSMATDTIISKHVAGSARGGELMSSRHRSVRPAASGPSGTGSVAQAAGSLLMQGPGPQQVRGASTGDQAFMPPGHAYHTDGPQLGHHFVAGENVKGSSAPDRIKALASKYDGGLRQSQTRRNLAPVEGRVHPSTLPVQHNDSAFKLSHALNGQPVPQSSNLRPPSLNVGNNYGGSAMNAAQVPSHFSPMTNASLRFHNQGLRNADQIQHPARQAVSDEVGSPSLAAADRSRLESSIGAGLVASASVDRRASQVATKRFQNAEITGGAGEISPESPPGPHASALQPAQRSPETHFVRPSQAHSATKRSGHFKINPLVVESNRTSHVDHLRTSGLDAVRAHDLSNAREPGAKAHANIFSSIDGYHSGAHPPKQGLHMTEPKRPIIKKDNILFSSAGASVPTFRKQPAPQAPQAPMMVVSGVGRRPSEQQVGRPRPGGGQL